MDTKVVILKGHISDKYYFALLTSEGFIIKMRECDYAKISGSKAKYFKNLASKLS